jgi:hypothetical protein
MVMASFALYKQRAIEGIRTFIITTNKHSHVCFRSNSFGHC